MMSILKNIKNLKQIKIYLNMIINTIEFIIYKYYNKIVKYIKSNTQKIIWNNISKNIINKLLQNLNYIK